MDVPGHSPAVAVSWPPSPRYKTPHDGRCSPERQTQQTPGSPVPMGECSNWQVSVMSSISILTKRCLLHDGIHDADCLFCVICNDEWYILPCDH